MIGEPTDFWGKLDRSDDGTISWHPLTHHCADVAACAEAILFRTNLRRRLATLGSIDHLTEQQLQRLCVLAAIHDFGKFSIGFQNKGVGLHPTCGHLSEAVGLLFDKTFRSRVSEALSLETIDPWLGDPIGIFFATVGHHGQPIQKKQIDPDWWQPNERLDPFEGISRLVDLCRKWFPLAWKDGGKPLPVNF